MSDTLGNLEYPVAPFVYGKDYTLTDVKNNLKVFSAFPAKLETLVKDWNPSILATSYRPVGWNARQIIHHLGDSHGNFVIRVKGALTEEPSQIKPYDENRWIALYDGTYSDIKPSLQMLQGIHARMTDLFNNLNNEEWQLTAYHPGSKHMFTVAELLANYTWHGEHHYGQLKLIEKIYKGT